MLETLAGVVLLLTLCHIGTLFGRLVFVYTIERSTTRFCFNAIFALSTFIFILVLLNASKIGGFMFSVQFSTRALRLAIIADLLTIAFICPLFIIRSLLYDLPFRNGLALLVLSCVILILYFAASTPVLRWALQLSQFEFNTFTLWEVLTATVALLGVTAVGVLSGYAAITTPAAFLRPFIVKENKETARVALGVLAKRQRHLLSLWMAKQQQIAEAWRATTLSSQSSQSKSHSSSFLNTSKKVYGMRIWSWVIKSFYSTVRGGRLRGGGGKEEIAKLKAESDGISAVSMAIFLQMSEMDSLVRSAESGDTWRGWFEALVGVILLFHTILKIVFVSISLVRCCLISASGSGSVITPQVDTATRVVNFLETYGLATPHGEGAEQRVVWVSLTLNAWMIVSSIRGFLLTVFRLVMTYTAFLSVDTTVLGLTSGMGAYFIGQLLLLRLSPTLESQSVLSIILQEQLPRSEIYRHINDLVFVITSALTLLVEHFMASHPTATLHTVAE